VPHISLVFCEMWETTNLDVFPDLRKRHLECSGLPNLAKNERDIRHPTILGREKKAPGLVEGPGVAFSRVGSAPNEATVTRYGFVAVTPISLPHKSCDTAVKPALPNSSHIQSIPKRIFR
jgi:hypothetical protein